ncbi:carboxymuconolactone decarboxylase family protein [Marinicauda pacifica]|uniref:carboxymuconolactone decarboxylase family protein n=1 Tax=Marinicauda pacifica TaxID=1133559 RepID=UPI0035C79356
MQARLDILTIAPQAIEPVLKLEQYLQGSGLEQSLYELVKIRASQINGCAFCLHMHTRDARAAGESDTRLDVLSAWSESPLYTNRERAALAWTEALTRVADTHAPDDVYKQARAQFDEKELVHLSLLISTINLWNRLAIGFRNVHPVDEAGHDAPSAAAD